MATLATKQLVASLYIAAFGRAPDKAGLVYWCSQMDDGFTFDSMIIGFLASTETESRYGLNISDQSFIRNLYHNLLSREPDQDGAAYWTSRLGEVGNRNGLVKEILQCLRESPGTDHQIFQNKIDAGLNFADSFYGDNHSYADTILDSITSDPLSVTLAPVINDHLHNPQVIHAPDPVPVPDPDHLPVPDPSPIPNPIPVPVPVVIPGPAPTIILREDTGALSSDGVTSNGTIDIGLPPGAQSWQYSTDGGTNWQLGSGSSFVAPDAIYSSGSIVARYVDSSGVTSEAGSIEASLVVNAPANHFYGSSVKADFNASGQLLVSKTFVPGPGVERGYEGIGGFRLDVADTSIKFAFNKTLVYNDNVLLVVSDPYHDLAAFKDISITNNTVSVSSPSPAVFDKSRISISDDVITINLSGVKTTPTSVLEFEVIL
ncbi:DUF4214 domain-containing protein [Pseudomonas sp. UBA1879]|uniref:DUF4214 domain-containing protein n=1 Tax=Pseudomonas sp. UBA1879 TaxID=1947305 RepID=UPI0025E55B9F|nr:DUF4214 domain-containing protein [Pseudomonas sp. UBA1879]